MTTKRKECFAYSKEVGGDPVACVEGDRTGSDFYIDSAMGYANYVWRARGMCVKEVSVAPSRDEAKRYACNVYAIAWQSEISHLFLKKGPV